MWLDSAHRSFSQAEPGFVCSHTSSSIGICLARLG
jgi:hypothetical protein